MSRSGERSEFVRELEDVQALPDAADRAREASELVTQYQALVAEASQVRREAIDELVSRGMTHAEIAKHLGMTRARVGQLLTSGPRPERAILGSGPLTVAMGGKFEAGKTDPGAVVSAEQFAAFELLAEAARSLGLRAESEVVPPPGHVRLNRTNLVVMGSPRILPFVGQVLESDPALAFAVDGKGWYLVNHRDETEHRSPSDSGENCDYAYLGRLPRPDGHGTFLYLAGIHATGTLGAVHWLTENIGELYEEVKNRRWSALIASHYDPMTGKVERTERITPVYRHEGI